MMTVIRPTCSRCALGTVIEMDSDTLGQTYQGSIVQSALAVAANAGDGAGERGNRATRCARAARRQTLLCYGSQA